MQALATVHNLPVGSVYNDIMVWLNKHSEKSRTEYRRDVNEFFRFIHGKTIENITEQEIQMVNEGGKWIKLLNKHVEMFKNHLKQKNSDGTIMRKIYSNRSLYEFLQINGYSVNHLIFETSGLKNKPKGYGFYTQQEVLSLYEVAKEEKHNGDEMAALILLAAVSSIRLSALLSLKWTNVSKDEKTGLYVVETIDKNEEEAIAPFEEELYQELIAIKEKYNSDLLFPNLKVDKVEKTILRLNIKLGLDEKKNLRFHSLRKVGINYAVNVLKDLNKGRKQGRHKSAEVMITRYTENHDNLSERAGIQMFKKVNHDVFDLVSKEELLDMLKEMDYGAYQQLALNIQKIIE